MDTDEPPVINRARAMELLGVSETTFHRWLAKHPEWKVELPRPGAWYSEFEIMKYVPPASGS